MAQPLDVKLKGLVQGEVNYELEDIVQVLVGSVEDLLASSFFYEGE